MFLTQRCAHQVYGGTGMVMANNYIQKKKYLGILKKEEIVSDMPIIFAVERENKR